MGSRVHGVTIVRDDRARSTSYALAVFAFGATSALQLGGVVYTMLSALSCLLLPAFLAGTERSKFVVLLIGTSVTSQLAILSSSLVNGQQVLTSSSLSIAVFAVQFLAAYLVVNKDSRNVLAYTAGTASGTVVWYVVEGTEFSNQDVANLWKYGVAVPITLIAMVFCSLRRYPAGRSVAILMILAAVSVALDFRSHALICLACSLIFALQGGFRRSVPFFLLVPILGVAALGVQSAAASGVVGTDASQKFVEQEDVNPNLVLSGRTEVPVFLAAVLDSPIMGHGAKPEVSRDVDSAAVGLAYSLGYYEPSELRRLTWYDDDYVITDHSIVLSSWVQGGLLALALPILLVSVALSLLRGRRSPSSSARFAGQYLAAQMVWDLLFSPLSYGVISLWVCLSLFYALFDGKSGKD